MGHLASGPSLLLLLLTREQGSTRGRAFLENNWWVIGLWPHVLFQRLLCGGQALTPHARGGPGRPFARPTAGPVLVVCLLWSVLSSVVAEIRPPEALPSIFRNPSIQGVPLGIRAARDKLAVGGLWGVPGG